MERKCEWRTTVAETGEHDFAGSDVEGKVSREANKEIKGEEDHGKRSRRRERKNGTIRE